jgi:hypothetical protein
MALLYGAKFIQQSTDEADAHAFAYNTARSSADTLLLDVWNAATNAGREWSVDKDGKMYSGALTEGDILYAVAGGVTGVKRLDSLGIGTAGQILATNSGATAPEWTSTISASTTFSGGLTVSSGQTFTVTGATITGLTAASVGAGTMAGLLTCGAGLTVSSGQTLTVTGATITGLTAASVGAGTFPSGTFTFAGAVGGVTTLTATTLAGTLSTAAQTNVTSLGTLTALACSGTLTVDTIAEHTGAAGVTIDGLLVKDDRIGADAGSAAMNGASVQLQYNSGVRLNIGSGFNNLGDNSSQVRLGHTAAIATTATDGFVLIPNMAGTPTGTPTTQGHSVALAFDTTNNNLMVYDGAWIGTTLASVGTVTGDTISEYTAGSGVTADGVLMKDNGIQTDQGAAYQRPLSMARNDVAHGMTDFAQSTRHFGELQYYASSNGGLSVIGYTDTSSVGLWLAGHTVGESTTKSSAGRGCVEVAAWKANGTGRQVLGSNANIFAVRNGNSTTVAIVDVEGELHLDATVQGDAWDEYDDVALLTGLRGSLMSPQAVLEREWAGFVEYARPVLESSGVVTYNEDGHHFVSMKRLNMLLVDAIRQLHGRIEGLERQLLTAGNSP